MAPCEAASRNLAPCEYCGAKRVNPNTARFDVEHELLALQQEFLTQRYTTSPSKPPLENTR